MTRKRRLQRRIIEALEERILPANDLMVVASDLGVGVSGDFFGKGFFTWRINTDNDSDFEIDRIFGIAGAKPDRLVVGDWDGNGTDDFGAVREETVFAGNSQKYLRWYLDLDGDPDAERGPFIFGLPGDSPVVGDWDGNGTSDRGVARSTAAGLVWYFDTIPSTTNGNPDLPALTFGVAGSTPMTGDWNADGVGDVGYVVKSGGSLVWHLYARPKGAFTGFQYPPITFGPDSAEPIVGNWDASSADNLGYVTGGTSPSSPMTWTLDTNGNYTDSVQTTITYGVRSDVRLVGNFRFSEVQVTRDGVDIKDRNLVPSTENPVENFGVVNASAPDPERTFRVTNTGNANLTLGNVAVPAGYELVESLVSVLAPGQSDTFLVRLTTNTRGTYAGDISFTTNDGNETNANNQAFNFRITGQVQAPVAQVTEAAVNGGRFDFGTVNQDVVLEKTFTLRNLGDADMVVPINSVSVTGSFPVLRIEQPKAGTLKPNEFATFKIVMDTHEFTVNGLGQFQVKMGTVAVQTNDPLRAPLMFPITGGVDVVNSQDIGVFRGTRWFLDIDRDPAHELSLSYGLPGDIPVVGNWDGGDREHIGVVRKHPSGLWQWLLDLDGDPAHEIEFFYGLHSRNDGVADDIPIVGDWNGDGRDDLGVVRRVNNKYQWLLNTDSDSDAELIYEFGEASANTELVMPVVGRWIADDPKDYFGVVTKRAGDDLYHWLLDTDRDPGVEHDIRYGLHSPADHPELGDRPVVGDWDGDGDTDIGTIHESPGQVSIWYLGLNDSRSRQPKIDPHVEYEIRYGLFGDTPVVGQWLRPRFRPKVEGFVWLDRNENGLQEPTEPVQANVTIYVDQNHDGQLNVDSQGNPIEPFAITDQNGFYRFDDLVPGTSTLAILPPTGLVNVYPARTRLSIGETAVNYDAVADLADQLRVELTTTASATTQFTGPPNTVNQAGASPKDLVNLAGFQSDLRFEDIDGSGTAIVVIDTGIDLDHPAFGPDVDGDGIADRIVFQKSFVPDETSAADTNGHGTHVSGIAAGEAADFLGIAPKSDIIHLKVFPNQTPGVTPQANEQSLEQALQWIIENAAGYHIVAVNLSVSAGNFPGPSTGTALSDEFEALKDLGIITVAAAGNAYVSGVEGVAYPATEPSVIAVGAVTTADVIASFSQRDDAQTDVYAPGVFIRGPGLNGQAAVYSGTSQAAPFVTGAAVLMQQLAEKRLFRRLEFTEFVDLLRSTGAILEDPSINGVEFRRLDIHALADAVLDKVNSNTHVVKLATSDQVNSINFGVQVQASSTPQTGSISGTIDGLASTSADVALYRGDVLLAQTTSDANGSYSFAGLDLSSVYEVRLEPVSGQEQVGPATPAFVGVGTPTTNTKASGVTTLDFDDDSRLDLAIVGARADQLLAETVELFRNTTPAPGSAPSFAAVGTLALPPGFKNIQSLAAFESGGRTWLAVAAANQSNNQDRGGVLLFEQVETVHGSTGFAFVRAITEFSDQGILKPSQLHVTDLDNDGKDDLVVVESRLLAPGTKARVGVLWGGGTIALQPVESFDHRLVQDVAFADINGDGRLDLVLVNSERVVLRLSTGATGRTYRAATEISGLGTSLVNVVAGDFDLDGDLDIAVGRGAQAGTGASNLLILKNQNRGAAFEIVSTQQAIGATDSDDPTPAMTTLTARDLNDDGYPDLAVTLLNVNKLFVLFNQTTADSDSIFFQQALSFTPSLNVPGLRPSAVIVADLNGDGTARPEIVVANGQADVIAGEVVGYFDVFQNIQDIGPQIVTLTRGTPDQTDVNFQVGPSVNTAPNFMALSPVTVDEHTPKTTLVAQVVATDADSDPLTYSIVGGTGQGVFSISPANGQVFVANPDLLDFETLSAMQGTVQPELSLVVQVRDSRLNTATTTLILRVANTPEFMTVGADAWPEHGGLTVTIEAGELRVRDSMNEQDVIQPRLLHEVEQLVIVGRDSAADLLTLRLTAGELPLPIAGLRFDGRTGEDVVRIFSAESISAVETVISMAPDGHASLTWNQRLFSLSGIEHWTDQVLAVNRRFIAHGELSTNVMVLPAPMDESVPQIEFEFVPADTSVIPTLSVAVPVSPVGMATLSISLGAGNDVVDLANLPATTASVFGGAGDDLLIGGRLNDRLEGESGNDTLNGGQGDDTLIGGLGDDAYEFTAAMIPESDTVIEFAAQGDNDLLDFSHLPAAINVSLNLSSSSATQTVHSNRRLTLLNSSAKHLEHVIGGAGHDTLTGNGSANRLEGREGNDSLIGAAGNDTLVGGVGNDSLMGKAGNDVYLFEDATSLNERDFVSEQTSEGSSDRLDFSAMTLGVTVDVSLKTAQLVSSGRMLTMSANSIENVTGGRGNDILRGSSAANRLEGGPGDDQLFGRAGNDIYVFDVAETPETDTIIELAKEGNGDQLDFNRLPADVPLTLGLLGSVQMTLASVHTNRNLILNPDTIETVIGGAGDDLITGNRLANRLEGRDGNDTLSGGLGNDTLDGGSGANTVRETAPTSAKVDFTLTNSKLAGSGSLGTDTLLNLQSAHLIGSPSKDSFNVSGWMGTGRINGGDDSGDSVIATRNSGFVLSNANLQTSDGLLNFALENIENANLTGGTGHDLFDITGWTGTAKLVGGRGVNTLASTRDADVVLSTTSLASPGFGTVVLSQLTVARLTGGESDNTFNLTGWKGQGTLTGGGGLDTVVASRNANSFILSDSRLMTTAADNLDVVLVDIRVANLTGSSRNDTFVVSQWTGGGSIHGGAGGTNDRIHASRDAELTTLTNMALISSGFGVLTLTGIENAFLEGGPSDNKIVADQFTLGSVTLLGGAGHDVLIGGAKSDSLDGGSGRDLLVGGLAADTINGNADQDILIGGLFTRSSNVSDLDALLTEWKRDDLDYAMRIINLRDIGVDEGRFVLNQTTVLNDANAGDRLMGGLANVFDLDWFFRSTSDVLDALSEETVTIVVS